MTFFWHIVAVIGISLPNILGYNLVFGKGKILHFGPIGVSLVAAYATVVTLGATGNYVLAAGAGLASALLLSAFFAWLSLRLEPDGLGVMSIAVHLATIAVVLNWTSLTRGALGIPQIPRLSFVQDLPSFAIFSASIAVLWAVLLFFVHRSSIGRQLSALAEHDWHAAALGVSRRNIHLWAFLLAGAGAAITGFLAPQYIGLLHPDDYSFQFLIIIVMIIVAGKPGSVPGVVLSAVLLTLLKEGLRFAPIAASVLGPVRLILFGTILFAAVWWRRDTLFPMQRKI